jgi:hypothetical protein
MSRGIIYLILNKQNGHKYVGNTTLGMNKEWVHHIERSKRMSTEPLHKAFRDQGVHNFMIKEIDECDASEFESKLSYWIGKYTPEYNDTIIEKKEDIIEQPKPPTIKQKKRGPTPAHLKPFDEHTRSDGKHSGLKIRGKNLETGKVYEWNSAREAAAEVTGDPKRNSNILNCARKGYKYYGYKWQIMEEKTKKKAIFGVNKKTEQIELRYESIAEAVRELGAEINVPILKSLRNPGRCSYKGYYWFYVNYSSTSSGST